MLSVFTLIFSLSTAFAMSLADLKSVVEREDVKSVEDVLPRLPEQLRRNFTLVFDSLSLQSGTVTHPRAILFDPNGGLILSFNGHPQQKGFHEIEVMAFDKASATITMHRVDFRKPVRFSKPNPRECLACHGESPRYLWPHYNQWHRTFGSADDTLSRSGAREQAQFRAFWQSVKAIPDSRYRHLIRANEDWPYHFGTDDRGVATMPNYRLNLIMTDNYAAVVAQRLRASAQYEVLRPALLYSSLCAERFLHDRSIKSFLRSDQLSSAIQRAVQMPLSFALDEGGTFASQSTGSGSLLDLVAKHLAGPLAGARLDIPLLAQSGPFPEDMDAFRSRLSGYMYSRAPERSVEGKTQLCQELQNEVRQRSADIEQSVRWRSAQPSRTNGAEILDQAGCVQCHATGLVEVAPQIPFNDAAALHTYSQAWLGQGFWSHLRYRLGAAEERPSTKDRMPRAREALTRDEAEVLIRYLQDLVSSSKSASNTGFKLAE